MGTVFQELFGKGINIETIAKITDLTVERVELLKKVVEKKNWPGGLSIIIESKSRKQRPEKHTKNSNISHV